MRASDLLLIRAVLAIVWLATGALSMGIYPRSESLALLENTGLHGNVALSALYAAATLDILLGILTLTHPSTALWRVQAILIAGYSAIIACYLPEYWLHPFGPVLKNLPILLLLWFLHEHEEKTS
ncbi:MAG TPA: DoxX-like family protein [Gallionella sp.]|nr:DoxX-like family protein [Gallionella sp.]